MAPQHSDETERPEATEDIRARMRRGLVDAMKARDQQAVAALRSTLARIDNAEALDAEPALYSGEGHPAVAGSVLASAPPTWTGGSSRRRRWQHWFVTTWRSGRSPLRSWCASAVPTRPSVSAPRPSSSPATSPRRVHPPSPRTAASPRAVAPAILRRPSEL